MYIYIYMYRPLRCGKGEYHTVQRSIDCLRTVVHSGVRGMDGNP